MGITASAFVKVRAAICVSVELSGAMPMNTIHESERVVSVSTLSESLTTVKLTDNLLRDCSVLACVGLLFPGRASLLRERLQSVLSHTHTHTLHV